MFLAIEGAHGVGKSYFIQKLKEKIPEFASFAAPSNWCSIRDSVLTNDMTGSVRALLCMADMAHVSNILSHLRNSGVPVLCDRWLMSTALYNFALQGDDWRIPLRCFQDFGIAVPSLYLVILSSDHKRDFERTSKAQDKPEEGDFENYVKLNDMYQTIGKAWGLSKPKTKVIFYHNTDGWVDEAINYVGKRVESWQEELKTAL